MMRTKYGAHKVHTDDGTFDSKAEYARWLILKDQERLGRIYDLERQVPYILIPAQYAPGANGKRGRLLEREVKYIADFRYRDGGKLIIEDVKGMRTKEYIIKRKLMLMQYGIQITEV